MINTQTIRLAFEETILIGHNSSIMDENFNKKLGLSEKAILEANDDNDSNE
jgi:hypothetical protein